MDKKKRSLARCREFDFGIEDHGMPFLWGRFEYDDGGEQGFGIMVDLAFIMRFMDAVGSDTLQGVNGKACWVTYDNDRIYKIESLYRKNGRTFDIDEWSKWKRTFRAPSTREQRYGEEKK